MTEKTSIYKSEKDSPGLLLWQTTTNWQREIKSVLLPYKILHSQFVVLAILLWFKENGKTATQKHIVDMSKMDKMNVSKIIKKLMQIHMVESDINENDSRTKTISLTSNGSEIAQILVKKIEEVDERFFGKLSQTERVFFRVATRKLSR